MNVDLNMNNNNILNLPYPASATEPVRLQDITGGLIGVVTGVGTLGGMTSSGVAIASGSQSIGSSVTMGSGQLLVGQASGSPLAKTMSGDVSSISAAGVVNIGALGGGVVTLPASPGGNVVTTTNTQTLTNKTISGANNTVGNLNASAISAGTMATARLGSGTANNTTFLRGDSTWASSGGGTGTTNQLAYFSGANVVSGNANITTNASNDLLVGGSLRSGTFVRLSADSASVTSSTTMVNSALSVSLEAGTAYIIDAYLIFTSATSGGGYRYDFGGGSLSATSFAASEGTITTNVTQALTTAIASQSNPPQSPSADRVTGFILVNAAGTLIIRFAQGTSNATSTVLKAGSWLMLHQVA